MPFNIIRSCSHGHTASVGKRLDDRKKFTIENREKRREFQCTIVNCENLGWDMQCQRSSYRKRATEIDCTCQQWCAIVHRQIQWPKWERHMSPTRNIRRAQRVTPNVCETMLAPTVRNLIVVCVCVHGTANGIMWTMLMGWWWAAIKVLFEFIYCYCFCTACVRMWIYRNIKLDSGHASETYRIWFATPPIWTANAFVQNDRIDSRW